MAAPPQELRGAFKLPAGRRGTSQRGEFGLEGERAQGCEGARGRAKKRERARVPRADARGCEALRSES